jgi:hypothetical protein
VLCVSAPPILVGGEVRGAELSAVAAVTVLPQRGESEGESRGGSQKASPKVACSRLPWRLAERHVAVGHTATCPKQRSSGYVGTTSAPRRATCTLWASSWGIVRYRSVHRASIFVRCSVVPMYTGDRRCRGLGRRCGGWRPWRGRLATVFGVAAWTSPAAP